MGAPDPIEIYPYERKRTEIPQIGLDIVNYSIQGRDLGTTLMGNGVKT